MQVELEKTAGSRWTFFGARVPRAFDYPIINLGLNPRWSAACDHNARPWYQTDEHHGNSATIRSKSCHCIIFAKPIRRIFYLLL